MPAALPSDRLGRPLGVLRLSLTARCNLACPYCLPDGQEPAGLLTLDQRRAVVEAAVALGATSLRLTGGEPLLNPELEALIVAVQPLRGKGAQQRAGGGPDDAEHPRAAAPGWAGDGSSQLGNVPGNTGGQPAGATGLREVTLTSNGQLLSAERAQRLRAAGLDRLTLSLDGTTGESVARMAGLATATAGERTLEAVLRAIEHAIAAGFDPASGALKLNAVIQRGANDDQLLPLAALARQRGVELRLIEVMDVGNRNGWRPEAVLSAAEMVARIHERWGLEPLGRGPHGTASRWRYRDGAGHLAVVASISAPFCGDCNRLRVTADGIAYSCLFAAPASGLDLRPWLQPTPEPAPLREAIAGLWRQRADRYSEDRGRAQAGMATGASRPAHAEMAYLGG